VPTLPPAALTDFATRLFEAAGEREVTANAFAAYFVAASQQPETYEGIHLTWTGAEFANLRAALVQLAEVGDGEGVVTAEDARTVACVISVDEELMIARDAAASVRTARRSS
jgi:hypothetical protein